MLTPDAIDAHVRNAIVGASAGAALGSMGTLATSTLCACVGALLMVWAGRKDALASKPALNAPPQ